MSVLSSSLFVLAPVYHCSLVVLLHCAVSWINKQKQTILKLTSVTSEHCVKLSFRNGTSVAHVVLQCDRLGQEPVTAAYINYASELHENCFKNFL